MNILFWVLQILLAVHTAVGALWKFSHSAEQTMPSLKAIPPGVWLAMSILELVCALALIVPAFNKSLGILVPIAAGYVILEMLIFCGLQLASGVGNSGSLIYWLV